MKLASLVPQYFYQHKKVSLPGIGIFTLDEKVAIPEADDKNVRDFLQHIQFKQSNVLKAEDALIDFIRVHTGKIKPLAESDLESYVSDGKLMLNIGKPFHIEGIGTLVKNRNGVYEFTPGEPMMERFQAVQPLREKGKGSEQPTAKRSVFDEDYYPHESRSIGSRKLMIIGGIVLGLAVVIWGGYTLYNKKVEPASSVTPDNNILAADSTGAAQADSLARLQAVADSIAAANGVAAGSYKFVFESTPNKKRAIRRHQQVSDISRGIKLESNPDSTSFSIYVVLPATPIDTTRLKDSLNAWYYGSRPLRVAIAH